MPKWNCPKCNGLIDSWDMFCRYCGNRFHKTFSVNWETQLQPNSTTDYLKC